MHPRAHGYLYLVGADSRMRLFFLITELFEGGAENALGEVARGMTDLGHTVRVASLFGATGAVGQRLAEAGIPVTDLGIRRPWHVGGLLRLRRQLQGFAPDLVHAWLFHAGLVARLTVRGRRPVVCGLRVVEPRHSHAFVEGLTRHYVSHYTCVSAAVAGFARKTLRVPGEQISVIPNGVHVPAVVPGARDLGSLHGVTVGRVTRQKGIDTMLAALAALPAGMVWDWAFVGEHPEASYSEAMREMATKLGLAGRVRWVGPVPRSAMDRIYRESNLLALPSRWEGQPNAILEAFAYDLPVVATDVDGTRDFEDEAPGAIELVSPESPTALAAAVLRLSSDGALRQRRQAAGRRLVCARNWPCICDRYDELYQRVIEQWRHDPARHP